MKSISINDCSDCGRGARGGGAARSGWSISRHNLTEMTGGLCTFLVQRLIARQRRAETQVAQEYVEICTDPSRIETGEPVRMMLPAREAPHRSRSWPGR